MNGRPRNGMNVATRRVASYAPQTSATDLKGLSMGRTEYYANRSDAEPIAPALTL